MWACHFPIWRPPLSRLAYFSFRERLAVILCNLRAKIRLDILNHSGQINLNKKIQDGVRHHVEVNWQ